MATTLYIASLILLGYLSVYSLTFIFLSVFPLYIQKKTKNFVNNKEDRGDVSILVPTHYEGEGIIDTIQTVLNQDFKGLIKIYILVNDFADDSIVFLEKFYGSKFKINKKSSLEWQIFGDKQREVYLIFSGLAPKKDKLNFWLKNVTTKYTAFLDADHRAASNWISSSITKLENGNFEAIQTKRQPLALSGLAQLWDSSQNHIGNELVNFVLSDCNMSVFFTGTTCLFKTGVFKQHIFNDCVTEDTYLSCDLFAEGKRIGYNDESSSYEEVAPNIKNFVFRRRRWSAGHTKTFFEHLKKILKAPVKLEEKIFLMLHGQFYLVPVVICLLLNVYGIFYFSQFISNVQLVVLIATLFLSVTLVLIFSNKRNNFFVDLMASFVWLFSQVSVLIIYIYKILAGERFYSIISFPYAKELFFWNILLFFSPLLVIISGVFLLNQQKNIKNIFILLTYPILMFFDIYASLLGFFDFLLGKSVWQKIKRINKVSVENVPESVRNQIIIGRQVKTGYKKYIFMLSAIVFVILANDLLAFNDCGEVKKFLWKPLIIKPQTNADLKIDLSKQLKDADNLVLNVGLNMAADNKFTVEYYIDNAKVYSKDFVKTASDNYGISFPLGFEEHKLDAVVKGGNIVCKRSSAFSTVLKELKNNSLYINNEKFIIKGIIPSFSNNQTNLLLDEGLKQIKEAGANTVRFYHSASDEIKNIAAKYNLMVIDQPDKSTWNEFNIKSLLSKSLYIERYKTMVKNNQGFPYLLFDGFGNEWELSDEQNVIGPYIKNLINEVVDEIKSSPSTYSTYLTATNYPVDISGINMLDSGDTYWSKAVQVLKDFKKPFYASEFGGFVAFFESLPTELRINRFVKYWDILMKAGSLGANYFESHDNWAQPVIDGYNDPFKPEQPDDTRGFWDNKNQEKIELKFLKQIFSDFDIQIVENIILPTTKEITLKVKNIRDYELKDVSIEGNRNIGNFAPLEIKTIKLVLNSNDINSGVLKLKLNYFSHHGLKNFSVVEIQLPVLSDKPKILNNDFVLKELNDSKISGELILSEKIDLVVPSSWQSFDFNGQIIKKNSARVTVPIKNPYHEVIDLEYSVDGQNWLNFESSQIAGGEYYLKFKIPKINSDKKYLLLSGTGSESVVVQYANGQEQTLATHPYRENIFDVDSLLVNSTENDYVTIKFNRQKIKYIEKETGALANDVFINMERPQIFSPININVDKVK